MGNISVGCYLIYTENRNGIEIAVCPQCGAPLNYRHLQTAMPATETGFFYCSKECAIKHVKMDADIKCNTEVL